MTKSTAIDPSTQTPAVVPVLIVGAGPTGLTLACELARRGIAFRLVEAAPGPQLGSRGKGIQPRTLEVFGDLGVIDRVLAHGRMAMPMQITAPDGQVALRGIETPAPRPDAPYLSSLITPEWRIEEALRLRLTELGGAVEFGVIVAGLEQFNDTVSATVRANGAAETITAHWLIGCDGGHSIVRKQAGITFAGATLEDVRMIVADVQVDGLDRDAWHMWHSREGMLALCPLPSTDLFQYQAAIAPGQNPELSLTNMQTHLERRTGRTDIRLRNPAWSSLWRANIRLADRYREGRVFLAGDAAHIHSPAGGQGMNTGIQDAYNLGWKLAAVIDGAPQWLLETYDTERQPIAARALSLSNARLKQTLDDNIIPTYRTTDTMQLGLNYRGSELARDDRDRSAAVRAGDRAPDATHLATMNGQRRLFDLTRGGRFTLLSFGGQDEVAMSDLDLKTLFVVERAAGPDDLADIEGHLTAAYQATARTLVLIRPDGYIALISDAGDFTAVCRYLKVIDPPADHSATLTV